MNRTMLDGRFSGVFRYRRLRGVGLLLLLAVTGTAVPVDRPSSAAAGDPVRGASRPDLVLGALEGELNRAFEGLQQQGAAPLYYLGYTINELRTIDLSATLGSMRARQQGRDRYLDVDLRVGSMDFDNTRPSRTVAGSAGRQLQRVPLDDDDLALRVAIWEHTDRAYKDAQERYSRLQTSSQLETRRDDPSGDFCSAPVVEWVEPVRSLVTDTEAWQERLQALSDRFTGHPEVLRSRVDLRLVAHDRYQVTSEGTRVLTSQLNARLTISGITKADDGMEMSLHEAWDAGDPAHLPSAAQVAARIDTLIVRLKTVREAPLVDPYSGPILLESKAAAVFFHEVFGHRVEGHRQKHVDEGQTFRAMVGEQIMPPFMSVYDDPTLTEYRGRHLIGHYSVDDEGVVPRRVDLVDHGVFRGFLMSRNPVEGFEASSGHGRREPGYASVARQGNLIIESAKTVPYDILRQQLIDLIREQNKPYGLIISDISGGFTHTGRSLPQSFKVQPQLVRKVHADGRPDQWVRGVDLVGTPLSALNRIVAAADDFDIFNGYCGAESGMVPVSAVAPSLLVSDLEVEKQARSTSVPPILPSPPGPPVSGLADDPVLAALEDELARNMAELHLPEEQSPYHLAYRVHDRETWYLRAGFGAVYMDIQTRQRHLTTEVRVGDPQFDNTQFASLRGGISRPGRVLLPIGDGYTAIRREAWLATDQAYRSAVQVLASKRAFAERSILHEKPDDFSSAPVIEARHEGPPAVLDVAQWQQLVRETSAIFRDREWIEDGQVQLRQVREVRWLVSSDGARVRVPRTEYELIVSARTLSSDGVPLSVYRTWLVVEAGDLPGRDLLLSTAREVARTLARQIEAEEGKSFVGPVLFTGRGASQFFAQLLARGVSWPRAPLMEDDTFRRLFDTTGVLTNRRNRRILPESFHAVDDPLREQVHGIHLIGYLPVDEEGVRPRALRLIEGGWLRDLPMSRTPGRDLGTSNGHARAGVGEPPQGVVTNLLITNDHPHTLEELTDQLREYARRSQSPYGLLITELHEPGVQARVDRHGLVQQRVADALLAHPMEIWRVYVDDGRLEPVRGYRFDEMSPRILRDIVAGSDQPHLVQLRLGTEVGEGVPVSVSAPDVLVEEVVLSPIEARRYKPYHLMRPR